MDTSFTLWMALWLVGGNQQNFISANPHWKLLVRDCRENKVVTLYTGDALRKVIPNPIDLGDGHARFAVAKSGCYELLLQDKPKGR